MTNHHNLRVGDVVVLKSGGPNMVIANINTDYGQKIEAVWLGRSDDESVGIIHYGSFYAPALTLIAEAPEMDEKGQWSNCCASPIKRILMRGLG